MLGGDSDASRYPEQFCIMGELQYLIYTTFLWHRSQIVIRSTELDDKLNYFGVYCSFVAEEHLQTLFQLTSSKT